MRMATAKEVKELVDLREFCEAHLERNRNTWNCPFCGSGTGRHRTSALQVWGDHYHCHACGAHGDVFAMAEALLGTDDFREALQYVGRWAHAPENAEVRPRAHARRRERDGESWQTGRMREEEYVSACLFNTSDPRFAEYLAVRGIDPVMARKYKLGFDPSDPKTHKARVIIPWRGAEWYHIDRAIDNVTPKYVKPARSTVGPQPIWDLPALDAEVTFVVEGALDAMAVGTCGMPATALGGAGNARLIRELAEHGSTAILLNDWDERGCESASSIAEGLGRLGCLALRPKEGFPGGAKDAMEAYMEGPAELAAYLAELRARALDVKRTWQPKGDPLVAIASVDRLWNRYLDELAEHPELNIDSLAYLAIAHQATQPILAAVPGRNAPVDGAKVLKTFSGDDRYCISDLAGHVRATQRKAPRVSVEIIAEVDGLLQPKHPSWSWACQVADCAFCRREGLGEAPLPPRPRKDGGLSRRLTDASKVLWKTVRAFESNGVRQKGIRRR